MTFRGRRSLVIGGSAIRVTPQGSRPILKNLSFSQTPRTCTVGVHLRCESPPLPRAEMRVPFLLFAWLARSGTCFSVFSRHAARLDLHSSPDPSPRPVAPRLTANTPPQIATKLHKVATGTTAFSASNPDSPVPFPIVLWRFTRPHTIIGSALAIPALHMLAAPTYTAAFSLPNLVSMVYAMIPALLMNLYITGLNQITDVEIDRINKPNLPIAAGDLSSRDATFIVLAALVGSLWMGVANPLLGTQGLNVALWGSGILGSLYSLPPFRLKRFPLLAAFCIVAVRGTIINASFFAHAKVAAFGGPASSVLHYLLTDRTCLVSSLFFGVFGIVIALMKDVPDVRGDQVLNIRTFSVRIGQKRIFHTMRRLLTILFFGVGFGFSKAALEAEAVHTAVCRSVVGVSSFVGGLSVRNRAQAVDPEDPKQVYSYYMHLWKLFYMSYLLLPLIR